MGNDDLATHAVLKVLTGSDLQKVKPFSIGAFYFHPGHMVWVTRSISSNRISVKYDPKHKGWAAYDWEPNILYVGFTDADTLERKANVVHEGTHAYFDWMKATQMKTVTSEAVAFLAQCQYAFVINPDPSMRLMSRNATDDKAFEIAWALAEKLQQGGTLTSTDVDQLKDAIAIHSFYKGKAHDLVGYDGLVTTTKYIPPPNLKQPPAPGQKSELILEELKRSKLRDDALGIQQLRQRLRELFNAVGQREAPVLHQRLAVRRSDDELSKIFYDKLHHATRAELLGILRQKGG